MTRPTPEQLERIRRASKSDADPAGEVIRLLIAEVDSLRAQRSQLRSRYRRRMDVAERALRTIADAKHNAPLQHHAETVAGWASGIALATLADLDACYPIEEEPHAE